MSKVTGRFYFDRTSNGNLFGEYSNNFSKRACPECAYLNVDKGAAPSDALDFVGEYSSVWVEDEGVTFNARLNITPKDGCVNIFSLKWTDEKGVKELFRGEAMLCGERLIGNYQDT